MNLPEEAIVRAQLLVGAVHEEGAPEVAALLRPLHTQDLYDLAVTLAAMVPDDRTATELLAWNDTEPVLPMQFPAGVRDRRERAFQLLQKAN